MPSLILGIPVASGAQVIVSGFPWSGRPPLPYSVINFAWQCTVSGARAYIALSGGGPPLSGGPLESGAAIMTINSGGMALSGGCRSGMMDGFPILPGGTYTVSRLGCGPSGSIQIFAQCDAAASGIGRLSFEVM